MMVRLQYQHVLMDTRREQKEKKAIMSSTIDEPISSPSESCGNPKGNAKEERAIVMDGGTHSPSPLVC